MDNREIKFRGWNPASEKMYHDVIVSEANKLAGQGAWERTPDLKLNWIGTISELMQYTGLKDKNEVEIYEGDILKSENKFGCHCGWGDMRDQIPSKRIVVFCGKHVEFKMDFAYEPARGRGVSGDSLCKGNEDAYEVIGNIYENPELLENA